MINVSINAGSTCMDKPSDEMTRNQKPALTLGHRRERDAFSGCAERFGGCAERGARVIIEA
jgi:hypothetical protein